MEDTCYSCKCRRIILLHSWMYRGCKNVHSQVDSLQLCVYRWLHCEFVLCSQHLLCLHSVRTVKSTLFTHSYRILISLLYACLRVCHTIEPRLLWVWNVWESSFIHMKKFIFLLWSFKTTQLKCFLYCSTSSGMHKYFHTFACIIYAIISSIPVNLALLRDVKSIRAVYNETV